MNTQHTIFGNILQKEKETLYERTGDAGKLRKAQRPLGLGTFECALSLRDFLNTLIPEKAVGFWQGVGRTD